MSMALLALVAKNVLNMGLLGAFVLGANEGLERFHTYKKSTKKKDFRRGDDDYESELDDFKKRVRQGR